jgi:hypothetical protein
MPHTTLDKMTKDTLVKAVRDYGCGKLKHLPLDFMTKEEILKHLEHCQCPLLDKLKR